jgi:predicted transposase/invertase (TIGR01784 family)
MDIFDCWIYIMKNMNMFEQMPFSEKYPVFRKLAEIGDLRKLSREELELYDEDIKNMRDIYATRKFDEKRGMEKGMAKGRAEGLAEGRAEGELSKGLTVARNLLAMGMSWTQIIQATGLTEDQLKQLQS